LGSTGSGSSRVNLKRLIRLDQVEEILNHLLEKIDNQDNMIRKLSQQCEQYQSVQLSHKQFQLLQDVCAQLQQQMDQLKIAAMCRVDNDKM
jgi:flagellar capping protein FliD